MSDKSKMFGAYKTDINGGVNPPYSPTYPKEWGCSSVRMVEVMTRVNPKKIEAMFAKGSVATPFEVVGDRVAFQFVTSQKHTMSYHNDCMFDMLVTAAVRFENYFAHTYLHMYNSDTLMIMAGREVLGFPEKDCRYGFTEEAGGRIRGWVNRRGYPIADFSFTPDSAAPLMSLVDGDKQPEGELHVRRVSDFSKVGTVYADIVYQNIPVKISSVTTGQAVMNLYGSEYDSLKELEPEILCASFKVFEGYDGTMNNTGRKLVKKLV
ncbi:acetoacetate decarboxylase family protein [Treponema sp. OMZ 840]|uniref:acetoacetate decarboxylase family protein n=1 Tax=Treponema sp. OMZ 840 TaxID=244313 RepID=UPI003D8C01E7